MTGDRKSLATRIWFVVLLGVVLSSGLICIVSIVQAREAIRTATRQRMIDIANCASGSVDGDVLKRLTKADENTDEYRKIYDSLAVFRDNIETEFIYGIREEEDGRFTFTVDPALENPGEFGSEVVKTDALVEASRGITSVDEKPYTDLWGTFYSAYSPVFDSEGNVAGIIGVDFSTQWYEGQQREQTRKTIIMYVIILVAVLIAVSAICSAQIKSVTGPIRQITQTAKRYRNGDYTGNLEIDRQDELGVLSRALQSMAKSLTEKITEAETANRAKSDFLASMSHEIRTPINAMLGNNEMILRESTQPAIREYSGNIKSAGTQLLGLVDEILAYSKNGEKPAKEEDEQKEGPRLRFTAPDARILAVDDNPMNLQVFLNLVKRTGIRVDTALSGDEGLKLACENKYDVLVFDHMMPQKDGIETLAELRSDPDGPNADTPAICLTANAIPGARQFYIGAGFDNYLTKPVDPDMLEDMLRTFIPDEKTQTYTCEEDSEEGEETIPDKLEVLRGGSVDIVAGIRANGSAESYMSVLKMFCETVGEKVVELNGLLGNKDTENYIIKVHALKSSLRIIGAEPLGEEAQRLEDAGKAGDQEYIENHHGRFITDFMQLGDDLSELFTEDEDDVTDRPEADALMMKEAFEKIRAAACDMDCDRLEAVFDEMDAFRLPGTEADLYKKLKAASDRFEYALILELLDNDKEQTA